jgi:hypothetical protein
MIRTEPGAFGQAGGSSVRIFLHRFGLAYLYGNAKEFSEQGLSSPASEP